MLFRSKKNEEVKTVLVEAKEPFNNTTHLDEITKVDTEVKNVYDSTIGTLDKDAIKNIVNSYNTNLLSIKERVRNYLIREAAKKYNNTDEKFAQEPSKIEPATDNSDRAWEESIAAGDWYIIMKHHDIPDDEGDHKTYKYRIFNFDTAADYETLEQHFEEAKQLGAKVTLPYDIDKVRENWEVKD